MKSEKLTSQEVANVENSKIIRARVEKARQIQNKRFKDLPFYANSEMSQKEIKEFCKLDDASISLMRQAIQNFALSARAYYRLLKIARTIADLEGSEKITTPHIAEALQYRFNTNI